MIAREITPDILSLVAIDWDRRIFDQLMPLHEGTTYNSYVVRGSQKTALIETVYPPFTADYLDALRKAGVTHLDYIIANHGEQDHSGSIPAILDAYPEAKVVTNARCRDLLKESMPIAADRFIEVKEGDTLSLGDKTLSFHLMPWVHWPDTMVSYLVEDKVLFTCDFFGSHLATSELFATEESRVYTAAKRYYAEIMMPFSMHIRKHLVRLDALEIKVIAPGHGPVYHKPEFILDLYKTWSSETPRAEVIVPYVSMYESTTQMVNYLIDRLMERGLTVRPFNLVDADMSIVAESLVEASTVVFASPAVLAGPHPDIVSAAYLANALKPKTKFVSVIGSYGWGGAIVSKSIVELRGGLKNQITFFEPVLTKGQPNANDYKSLDRLVEEITVANQPLQKPVAL
ncbi:FprA family A-type flavoprotein [Telmatobacter bradus]|uniref:FprA family A-type flavoprotein n=1 Tax=Telmatobacter bradus TaxID=474953 RepID=UPI003B43A326